MRRSQRKQTRSTVEHRASWKGHLTFGLVSFEVEAFNALDREHGDIHFHQLHSKCHSRIRYQKVCPIHGEVSKDEIVSGYEYKKGKYVEIEPEELEALRTESDRALKIDAFVSADDVDPLYFDGRMYYLTPVGTAAQEPYAVILQSMTRKKRCGVGQVVFSGKDQIALVRPLEGILHMAMLNYEAEIRSPETFAEAIKKPASLGRQVRLAETLIDEKWSDDNFDFSKYEDHYREKVDELIEKKMHGRKIVPPKEEKPEAMLNLMDALKKSIGSHSKTMRNPKKPSKRKSA